MNKLRQGATIRKACRRSNAEDRPADDLLQETVVCPLFFPRIGIQTARFGVDAQLTSSRNIAGQRHCFTNRGACREKREM